jgi:hypothetical protein
MEGGGYGHRKSELKMYMSRKDEIVMKLDALLVGNDPLTLTVCPHGHRLYPNEIRTGVCLRCAQVVAAKLRDRDMAAGANS